MEGRWDGEEGRAIQQLENKLTKAQLKANNYNNDPSANGTCRTSRCVDCVLVISFCFSIKHAGLKGRWDGMETKATWSSLLALFAICYLGGQRVRVRRWGARMLDWVWRKWGHESMEMGVSQSVILCRYISLLSMVHAFLWG